MSPGRVTASRGRRGYSGGALTVETCGSILLKKYGSSLAAVLTVAVVAAGGALAKSHHSRSFVVHGTLYPRAWAALLRDFRLDPQPLVLPRMRGAAKHAPAHAKAKAKAAHRHTRPHRQASHHRHASHHRLQPHHRQGTTLSVYEQTTKPWYLREQGCNAAQRRDSGVVVLDFGKPAFEHHGYGTILFSGKFAKNYRITTAMVAWARGYARCLPRHSSAFVTLARGTSNYHPHVPSVRGAGRHWALATIKFDHALRRHGLAGHVAAAAADDAEPAWDPHFRKTRAFISGFRHNSKGHTLYDYGSLDGGVGSIWSAKQAFYVAGGIRHTAALPEIYNHAMADEWAQLERIARSRFHSHVHFAGVMTQGSPHCHCSLRPHAAHHALVRALVAVGAASANVPQGGTNIGG
jgi:hypothetical protein